MKNKIIYILLIVIVIEGLFFAFRPNLGSIRTDSGWDSDYSSSSSSSSSGSYSSSSSGSSSGDSIDIPDLSFPIVVIIEIIFSVLIYIAVISFAYKWKYRHILAAVITIVRFIIALYMEYYIVTNNWVMSEFLTLVLFVSSRLYINSSKGSSYYNPYGKKRLNVDYEKAQIRLEELSKILDVKELEKELYQVFVDVQIAWMNFDYDALSRLCVDELYNSYKSDLEVLKLKDGKNIMSDFVKEKLNLIDFNENKENNYLDIEIYLQISFYDYVINTKNNMVFRGNKYEKMHNGYLLKYRKYLESIDKCPSCGATINSNKCDHCGNYVYNRGRCVLISKERV